LHRRSVSNARRDRSRSLGTIQWLGDLQGQGLLENPLEPKWSCIYNCITMKHNVNHKKRFKTLTLRNIPPEVADLVCDRAESDHLSFSQALVALLQERLAKSQKPNKKKRDLSWLWGSMSEEDARIMEESLREQRQIDPEMWK
jgi:hypothetical protein